MFSLLIFSLMALKLLSKRCESCSLVCVVGVALWGRSFCLPVLFLDRDLKTAGGAPYFSNYVDIVFDLYVLVTTANSPDVM